MPLTAVLSSGLTESLKKGDAVAERTDGLYRAITYPKIQRGLMLALGANRALSRYAGILDVRPGMHMLDVGCGTANIVAYLPEGVDYIGFDRNAQHVEFAKARYSARAPQVRFFAGDATSEDVPGQFDLINVSALLHHIDDAAAARMLAGLAAKLRPGGRLVTFDNVWLPNQRYLVRLVNSLDSGKNIRTPEQYVGLLRGLDLEVETRTVHDMLTIPYDHFIMICKARAAAH